MKKFCLVIVFTALMLTLTAYAQEGDREFNRNSWYTQNIEFSFSELIADNTQSSFHPASQSSMEWTEIIFENYVSGSGWMNTGTTISMGLMSTLPANQSLPDVFELVTADDPLARLGQGYESWNPRIEAPIANPVELNRLTTSTLQGVRFLIIEPTTDADFYVFEGVTLDEQYVISAYIPLASVNETGVDLLALLDTLFTSMTITNPTDSFLTSDTNAMVDYEGVSFSYDPTVAYRIQVNFVPSITGEDAEFTMYGVSPSWQEFIFVSEPRPYDTYNPPAIYAFPINEFPEEDTVYGNILTQLQTMLDERPDLATFEDRLPELPPINSAQVFIVYAEYLDFDGGAGIRYITRYAQEAFPVVDTDLDYRFIGITNDSKLVISALFPLYLDILPSFDELDMPDYNAFIETFQTYIADLQVEISQQPADAFVPSIDTLDSIVTSIQSE